MRLMIARCTVDCLGRLTVHLPEATRLMMVYKCDIAAEKRDLGRSEDFTAGPVPFSRILRTARYPHENVGLVQPSDTPTSHLARVGSFLIPQGRRRPPPTAEELRA